MADIPLTALAHIGTDKLLGRDTAGSGAVEQIGVSGGLGLTGAGVLELTANQRIRYINTQLFNAGAALTTGIKQDFLIPFACTITKATLLADQSGNVVIDIWKDTFANFPPTVADTITAAAKPTLSAAAKSEDATLTGWTTAIAAGDILRFNVDSVASITRLAINLDVETV